MVEETTAASVALAREAEKLQDRIVRFRLNGSGSAFTLSTRQERIVPLRPKTGGQALRCEGPVADGGVAPQGDQRREAKIDRLQSNGDLMEAPHIPSPFPRGGAQCADTRNAAAYRAYVASQVDFCPNQWHYAGTSPCTQTRGRQSE
jgi:hypothetical protein